MGQGESSRKIIPYETARRWMGPAEVRTIQEAFARLANNGHIDRQAFGTGFLGSANLKVPKEVADALFDAFNVSASGKISEEDFVCSLAVLRHGGAQARRRLLFNVYDVSRDGTVTGSFLSRFASVLTSGHDVCEGGLRVAPSMDWKEFDQWAARERNHPLVSWLSDLEKQLSEGYVPGALAPVLLRTHSAQERDEEQVRHEIAQSTGFTISEVQELFYVFTEMKQSNTYGVVDESSLQKALPSVPPQLRSCFLCAFDSNGSKTLSFGEFVRGIDVCIAGAESQQRDLCFLFFAVDGEVSAGRAAWLRKLAADGIEALIGDRAVFSRDEASAMTPADISWLADALDVIRMLGWLLRLDLKIRPQYLQEERTIVDSFRRKFDAQSPGQIGDKWYVISAHWWQRWCDFTGAGVSTLAGDDRDAIQPPPRLCKTRSACLPVIDNTELLDNAGRLRFGLHHGVDYELLNDACWQLLEGWYSHVGSELPCHVIHIDGVPELEVYPLRIWVSCTDREGNVMPDRRLLECSRVTPLGTVKKDACTLHGISCPVRLLHQLQLDNFASSWDEIDDEQIFKTWDPEGHSLLLDQTQNGVHDTTSGVDLVEGCVGLQNLGNTCYMNSALQCLLHTRLLRDYFDAQFMFDLNPESPRCKEWGLSGKLALFFADLVSEVSRSKRSVAPEHFRRALCRFRPDFEGWEQHDAQEFLASVLEGLGEDVNRISSKPYIELQDSEDRVDGEVAAEYWDAQMQRDWSIITALFTGQFKSTLYCETCGKLNAKFDSFNIVPVPLPEHDFQWVTCIVVEVGPRHTKVCVRVPKVCTVADVISSVAGVVGLPSDELCAADVVKEYVFMRYPEQSQFLGRSGVHTYLFHVPGDRDGIIINLVNRRLQRADQYFLNPFKSVLFAMPQMILLPHSSTAADLYSRVWEAMRMIVPDHFASKGAWPFKLSRVTRDGTACSLCGWREGCIGHEIPADCTGLLGIETDDTIALDWDATVFAGHYNSVSATAVAEHESLALARIEQDAPEQLDKCLEKLLQKESLDAYCSRCSKSSGEYSEMKQSKELRIWALPPVLVFQLKRFRNVDGRSYKLGNLVKFPLELDVQKFVGEGPPDVAGSTLSRDCTLFRLYGVVNHSGSVGAGHYTACVRREGTQWFRCNDSHCSAVPECDVVTEQAYLLFYLRADLEGEMVSRVFPPAEGSRPQDIEAIRRTPWPAARAKSSKRRRQTWSSGGAKGDDFCVLS